MDRICSGLLRGAHVLFRVQVARDLNRLVRIACVERLAVVGRDHRDGGDAERPARPEDAQRDLAAVGYEELADLHSAASVRVNSTASAR
jgi:urocanate hydratase